MYSSFVKFATHIGQSLTNYSQEQDLTTQNEDEEHDAYVVINDFGEYEEIDNETLQIEDMMRDEEMETGMTVDSTTVNENTMLLDPTTTAGTVSLVRGEITLGFVNVAPVPAKDFVQVTFASPTAATVKISLYDVIGKLISQENVDATQGNNQFTFDLTNVASGVYFISMEDNNGQNISTKLIKE